MHVFKLLYFSVCGTGVSCKPVVIVFMYTLLKFSSILHSDHFSSYVSAFQFLTVYAKTSNPGDQKKGKILLIFLKFKDHSYYTVGFFRKLHQKKEPN